MANNVIRLNYSNSKFILICPGLIDNLELMRKEIGASKEDEELAWEELKNIIYNNINNWGDSQRIKQLKECILYLYTNHEFQEKKYVKLLGLWSFWMNNIQVQILYENEYLQMKEILNEEEITM